MAGKPTINTYVSDMLALEQHLLKPFERQAADEAVAKSPRAAQVVNEAVETTNAHIAALEERLESIGGHAGSPVKSGVAAFAGYMAAAVENVRKTEVSKDLRDDFTALCLASASYTLLHATALGLGDVETADLAKRHLADEASLVMRVSEALPSVVLAELQDEGVEVTPNVAKRAEQEAEAAWSEGASRVRATAQAGSAR